DGRLADAPTQAEPIGIILLEGVYAARPELADLMDLTVLIDIDDMERLARLRAREGEIGPWEQQWYAAETHYFEKSMPVDKFDFVFRTPARQGLS
ncbi:MAG: hypothetical protein ACK4TG_08770, partial [Thermaurantiacus sp.]